MVPTARVSMQCRQAIAQAITKAHCDATGAPAIFVHVFFFDSPGNDASPVLVNGSIRAGRNAQQKSQIETQVKAAFAQHAGVPAQQTIVQLNDVPASWLMEGGRIMPGPGEEEAWLAAGKK
jgi:phenylpyruvate tautomerase PptA (4-oxalocrotonate tautomerase family)